MKKFMILSIITMFSLGMVILPAKAVTYTAADVAGHNSPGDCWTIINNKVYNLTGYISTHPGGAATVTPLCGINGTAAFSGQHSGSATANSVLASYQIGDLFIPDTSAPSVPAGLTATVASSTQINLNWAASTDNVAVTGYKIYRNSVQIATTTGVSYNNSGLTPATTYSYAVAAYDAAGNTSGQSSQVSATTFATSTPDTQVPTAPTGLAATPVSASQINLNWNASTDNIAVTGYQIFRNGVQVATSTGVSYNNTGLTASTTYAFTVKALDAAGNVSAASNSVSATTLAQNNNYQKWQKYYDAQLKKITKRYNAELANLKKKMDKALSKTTNTEKINKITEKYNKDVKRATDKYNKAVDQLKKQLDKKLNNLNGNKNGWHKDSDDDDEDDD